MDTTAVLDKDQFQEFFIFCNIIKSDFSDLSIFNGEFRSRPNSKSCIVHIRFEYMSALTFHISNIKEFVKGISFLNNKDCEEVTIVVSDGYVSFHDEYLSSQFIQANDIFLENTYIDDQAMTSLIVDNIDTSRIIIQEMLSESAISRINKVLKKVKTNEILIKHAEGDCRKGYMLIEEASSSQNIQHKYTFKNDFIIPMEEGCSLSIIVLPFRLAGSNNKREMQVEYYINNAGNRVMCFYKQSILNSTVEIYSRGAVLNRDGRTRIFWRF